MMCANLPSADRKVAVITGGTRGFGSCLVQAFCQNWQYVGYTSKYSTGQSIQNTFWKKVDVGNLSKTQLFMKQIENKWGRIDTLILNAGVNCDKVFVKVTENDINTSITTNIKGLYTAVRAVEPYMIKQKSGHIIAICSFVASWGRAGQVVYGATKTAIIGMIKSLARELGEHGIQVNAVMPGFLDVGMGARAEEKILEKARQENVLGRLASAEESAEFIVHLSSMKGVSGQVFNLDSRILSWI